MSTLMVTCYSLIVKFIFALHLGLSKPQTQHLLTFVQGIILTDGRKTISQIRRSTHEQRDLSCMTRFINESPWCPNRVTRRRIQWILRHIQKTRAKKGDTRPLTFLILDDTQSKKNRTTLHMEALDEHYSHADGKCVWSHCIVTAHVVRGDHSFAWDYRSYFRESYCEAHRLTFKSKNDLAVELIRSYPRSVDEHVYVLVDSWYTGRKVIDACHQQGFHLIGGLRVNRNIYPVGVGIKISAFSAQFIQKSDLRSVTVGDHTYKIYPYEGKVSNIEQAIVLLSWEERFDSSKTPFCLLCTDSDLDLETILRYYQVRWNIEIGYRYFKDLLGLDHYQLLSHKGIERFWCIQFLTANFLEYQRQEWQKSVPLTLGDVVRRIRKDHLGQLVVYAYEQGLAQKPLADVLKQLHLAV